MLPVTTTGAAYTLFGTTTLHVIATSTAAGVWIQRRDDDCDGTGGVREPRPPRPVAPSGAVALRLDS